MTANYSSSPRNNPQPYRRHRQSPIRSGLWLTLIGILLPTLIASCASAQPSDPVAIVQTAYDRINDGDVDGFMKLFSDDAVMVDRSGRYAGSQAIREYMDQKFVPEHVRIELSDISSDGNVVSYTSKVYQGDKLLATYKDGLDVIADGRIIFDGTERYRLQECDTDPSQAFCPEN